MSRGLGGSGAPEEGADRVLEVLSIRPEPHHPRVALEPGFLPPRQHPQPPQSVGSRLLERQTLLDVREQFPVADRLPGRARHTSRTRSERPNFVQKASGKLVVKAFGEPAVELGAVKLEADDVRSGRPVGRETHPEGGKWSPRTGYYLKGPDNPAPICRLDSLGCDRIQLAKSEEKPSKAARFVGLAFQLRANFRKTRRDRQRVEDGAVIKPGAPDEHRHVTTGLDSLQGAKGMRLELCDRELF